MVSQMLALILSQSLSDPASGCRWVGKIIICPDTISTDLVAHRGSGRKNGDFNFTPYPNPEPVGTGGTGTRLK